MEYTIQQKIDKLSKMNNYFRSKKAIKIILYDDRRRIRSCFIKFKSTRGNI